MRYDISDCLIHLSKGKQGNSTDPRVDAGATLMDILTQRNLKGGAGFIKGGHRCVCFSEAPVAALAQLLALGPEGYKYQPYGVMVSKKWLYEKGGRPAIYGPDADYFKLPTDMRYRHVRFELDVAPPIDHTWEREWRVEIDNLPITPDDVTVVVPNRTAKEAFVMGGFTDWHYIALSDLGVHIDAT
ncbi:hypothetical protein [Burkholderia stagnalis]|uniref:hypothetical protein n=1 Tax=Burkholderia stagnalis TaxID=1503054 RepID=UPI00075FC415|nr:hypothetical protein [Burkholderia stagnalis]KWI98468.1 hypothetical protein WT76_29530 [Burkholderia stagnalis]KWO22504.1 hypothetical protein WT94_19380 [Burkholderia stagnalis]